MLTAEENITLPLQLAGKQPDQKWLDQLIDTVGLRDRLTHRPSELSGGQQQRVAVARALVHRPAVLFADEPTGNLDSQSSEEVLGLLRQAVDEFGQTVIMVTHEPHAASVADRIVVLRDGEVVHDGAGPGRRGRARPDEGRRRSVTKLALKGLLSRKLRSVLTGFAVVIGVAFVVGTLVFTDTIDESFKNLFERTQQGVDVAIEARQAVKSDFSVPPTMPADTLAEGRGHAGRRGRRGRRQLRRHAARQEGRADRLQRPADAAAVGQHRGPLQRARLRERRPAEDRRRGRARPRHGQQVRLQGRRHGDRLRHRARPSSSRSPASPRWRGQDNLGGARLVVMTLPEAQRMTGHDGYDSISVATGGNDAEQVKAALSRELGRDFLVRTGEEAAEQTAQDFADALGFLRIALLVFAGVALLVGGFLIFNTFTVTVAQRTKEFALLRVLGASRGQILRSVLIETFVVGLVASILGVLAGLVVAPGPGRAAGRGRDRPRDHRPGRQAR